MENKLAVIIPAFNSEKYIIRCLESIFIQAIPGFEVIVVNDGSTDSTLDLVCQYRNNHKNLKVISTENKGVAHARNIGLIHAHSQYITFVDADDFIEKNAYTVILRQMERYHADIAEYSYRKIKNNGALISNTVLIMQVVNGSERCLEHFLKQSNCQSYMCNKIYRRSLFDGEKFVHLQYSEDYYMNIVLHKKAMCKIILSDIFYNYVIHEESACGKKAGLERKDGVKAGVMAVHMFRKNKIRVYPCFYVCRFCINNAKLFYAQDRELYSKFIKLTKKEYLYALLRIPWYAIKKNDDWKEYILFIAFAIFPDICTAI